MEKTADDYNRPQEEIVDAVSSGSEVRQVALLILAGFAMVSLAGRRPDDRKLRFYGRLGLPMIAFAGLACVSLLWADDTFLTLKRLVGYAILCMLSAALVRRYALKQILQWILFMMALYLVVALGCELSIGSFHPLEAGYRFSGVQHPNGEGIECALLFMTSLAAAKLESRHSWLYTSLALVALGFLVITGSRTALGATLISIALYIVVVSLSKTKALMIPIGGAVFSLILLGASTGLFHGANKLLVMGRDDVDAHSAESLTGRTQLWQDVTPYIVQRLAFGHGFQGFWTPKHIATISDEEKWGIPDSHSTYVDYLLTLGLAGFCLYLATLIWGLCRAIFLYRLTQNPEYMFLASFLLFCIVDGFSESSVGEGSLLTFLLTITLIRLAFAPLDHLIDRPVRTPLLLEEAYPT